MSEGAPTVAGDVALGAAADEPYVSLYRRFRPGRFGELRGQDHVVRALQSAVRDDHVSHAYLFSGPRGTGKTSTARILARALNCAAPVDGEPCGVCPSCVEIARSNSLDVHELDAASNNGVDAMRDLVAHAALSTPGRWKVYIVDEVHMLSNAAANALLKTLEEPPGHVVFVLATTDPQKVPPTIRSRTQHFEFRLLGSDTLGALLRDVRDRADLGLDDAALAVAVRRGRGSARDALSALDQVAATGSADDARPELSSALEALAGDDAGQVLVAVAALHDAGWGSSQLAAELVDDLRQGFLTTLAPELAVVDGAESARLADLAARLGLARLVRAMEMLGRALVDMREAPDPRVVLEVTLVRLARPDLDESPAALGDRLARLERAVSALGPAAAGETGAAAPPPPGTPSDPGSRPGIGALRRSRPATPGATPPPAPPAPPDDPGAAAGPTDLARPSAGGGPGAGADRDTVVEAWGDHVLRGLPARAKALYGAGHFASMEGATATFALPNQAHRDRCEEVRPQVEAALSAHVGTPLSLLLVVDAAGAAPEATGGTLPLVGGSLRAASGAGRETVARTAPLDDDDQDFDPEDPGVAVATESLAEARLLEAFPGAQEMPE